MLGFSVEKIISAVRKFVHDVVGKDSTGRVNDCLIIFDYIKMPQGGVGLGEDAKEYKVLGQIADALKMLAGTLDIPILSACQTNRAGGTANSYELEWFCNTFMKLTNKSQKKMDDEAGDGGPRGNQLLEITASRSGDEHNGLNFDYQRPILTYVEVG